MTPPHPDGPRPNSPHASRRHALLVAAVIISAAALRIALAFAADRSTPVLDETAYLRLAQTLAAQGRFDGTFRPPLYPAFMAAALRAGGSTLAIRLIQSLLAALAVAITYRLAARAFTARAALIAAGLVAADPVLIMFSLHLWSETLFIALLLLALDLVTSADDRRTPLAPPPPPARTIAAGVCLGLAALTRPVILTFLPFLAFWSLAAAARAGLRGTPRWKRAARHFTLIVAPALLTVSPWTLRNAAVSGAFIPIDSNGPFNLLVGSEPASRFVNKDNFWSRRYGLVAGRPYELAVRLDPAAAQRTAVKTALANVAADPLAFAAKSACQAAHLWTLDSFLLRHLRNRWYGNDVPSHIVAALTLYSAAFAALLTLTAAAGLAATPPSPTRSWTLLSVLHACLAFGLTYALSRYAAPLRPLLALFAAAALANPRAAIAVLCNAGWRSPRVWGLAAIVVALLFAWSADLPLLRDMLATGGAAFTFRMD